MKKLTIEKRNLENSKYGKMKTSEDRESKNGEIEKLGNWGKIEKSKIKNQNSEKRYFGNSKNLKMGKKKKSNSRQAKNW